MIIMVNKEIYIQISATDENELFKYITKICHCKILVPITNNSENAVFKEEGLADSRVCIIVNENASTGGLSFRSKRGGETLLRNGVNRQLRRLYREAGVPTVWREALPVLCDGEGVLWAPYVGCRDGAVADLNGKNTECYAVTVQVARGL